jgi:hypothetical protein
MNECQRMRRLTAGCVMAITLGLVTAPLAGAETIDQMVQDNPGALESPLWRQLHENGCGYLVFCCLPFGIVSIVKASQVSGLWAQGRYAETQKSSASARKWAMWGAIIGLIGIVIYSILYATNTITFETNTS